MRAIIDTVHVKVKPVERVFTLIPPLIQGKIENGGNPESGGFYARSEEHTSELHSQNWRKQLATLRT